MHNTVLGALAVSLILLIVGGSLGYGFALYQVPRMPSHTSGDNPAPGAISEKHTMDSSMSSMVNELQKQTGEARDVAFLESMIVHHQGAIEMAQEVAKSTKRPELKQTAETIISAQTAEIATMKKWLTTWFGR